MDTNTVNRAGRREWIGLAVLALACVVYAMDLTVLELAVPALSADLRPSSSQLLWILDIYGFMVAGFLITMGTLGDRIGRRRLLLIGAAAFGITSVLAAFSTSAGMLIATRALLGVAGATLAPSTLALISNMFLDPGQRTLAIGVWATSFSAGAVIGPLLGGVLLEFFWWGSVFLPNVPVMALLLVLGPVLLPEFRDPEAGRLDLISAAMSLAGVLAVIYGLKQIAEDGLGWQPTLSIAAGLAVGVVFVLRQRTLAHPLIDLRLFRVPAFSASLATNTLGIFAIGGAFLLIAQYLQLVLGLSPLEAGLWTVPSAGGLLVGSMLAPVLVRWVHPAFAVGGGLAVAAAGFGLLTQVDGASGLAVLVSGSVIFAVGIAVAIPLTTDLIVGTAPPERAGAASAISETGTELGGALGLAILGSIGTAVYRSEVATSIPAGVPSEAAEAARDTLGGAVGAADGLPSQLGAELLDTAREAFTQGLQLAAVTSAAIMLGMAILAVVLLRNVRTGSELEDQPNAEPDGAVAANVGVEKAPGSAAAPEKSRVWEGRAVTRRSQAILIVTGVMAAGKSTVAQLVAERLPKAVHLRGDIFRRMIVTGRREVDPEPTPEAMEQLRLRYRLAAMTADAYFDAGFTVVVQDTIVGALLPEFLELFRSRPLLLIILSPRPAAIRARENARRKTGYSEWSVEQLDRVLRMETPRLGLWIDSSEHTPEQTGEEILCRAWDEAVVR